MMRDFLLLTLTDKIGLLLFITSPIWIYLIIFLLSKIGGNK